MMQFWGSNKKQRNSIWVMLLIMLIIGLMWKYANICRNVNDTSADWTINTITIGILLFYVYLVFDNSRKSEINHIIKRSKLDLDKIVEKYNMEFNDILCRTHIANELKEFFITASIKNYNFMIIDKTTNKDVDSIRCIYEIWADNQFQSTYTILRNNQTILV